MKKVLHNRMAWLFMILTVMTVASCDDDITETPAGEDPVASFQFAVSETNWSEVTFSNFSQNATVYAWSFGDGEVSAEENPVHTYAEAGTYTVALVAANEAGATATFDDEIVVEDPDVLSGILTGEVSKKWILQREGVALGIGGSPTTTEHWSFGGVVPLGDRPCILDDEITFFADGSFQNNTNGTFFLDSEGNFGWNDTLGEDMCHDETEEGVFMSSTDVDVSALANGGSYGFEFVSTSSPATLTVNGAGAYVGLPNRHNGGGIGNASAPVSSINYEVTNLVDGNGVDSLTLSMGLADGNYWNFFLVHYENEAETPAIPSAMPGANFTSSLDGLEVTFTNTSSNSTTYSWDFGDEGTSTEENPVHTYAAAGTYTVTLVASDGTNESTISKDVSPGAAAITEVNIDFEDEAPFFDNLFGGSAFAVIDNPDASGINTSAKVGELVHGNETWAGIGGPVGGFLDFTDKTSISIAIYAPATGVIKIKLEDTADGQNIFTEFDADVTVANEWTLITVPLTDFTAGIGMQNDKFNGITLFPGWDTAAADTYYIDNITLDE